VLLDVTLANHERVGGHTVVDRPFVLGLIERLPFRDKAFDYVIAFHVLEHSADPVSFLCEMQRVARAGYIETPSFWWERLTPLTMHRLEVGVEPFEGGARLVINQKREAVPDSELQQQFVSGFSAQGALRRLPQNALVTRYFWNGTIHYRLLNPNERIGWQPPEETTRTGFTDPRPAVRRFVKWAAQKTHTSRPVDVVALLRCVDCGSDGLAGRLEDDALACAGCGRKYAVNGGIPELYPAGWTLRS
jgi:SAM-dependent methyltransferase